MTCLFCALCTNEKSSYILTRIHLLAKTKLIHNKLTKPRRENISRQGHKGRKDGPFEFLKSVFVAFAILL